MGFMQFPEQFSMVIQIQWKIGVTVTPFGWVRDCYKILHMPWHHICHAMCKISWWLFHATWWQQNKISIKKDDNLNKLNFHPISLLKVMSKIHEGMLSEQLCDYFYGILAHRMSGYRKKHSCQTLLLNMVEQWKQTMDKGEYVGAVLIDLSKAFDCLPHGLLIAKLKAYVLHPSAYRLLASYLHGRRQRVKVGNTRSEWALITKCTLQGSMMGNILFNVFLHDIFYVVDNGSLFNYADDNMVSRREVNLQNLVAALVNDTQLLITWFANNGMSANPDKLQALLLSPHQGEVLPNPLCVDGNAINPGTHVKLLGVTIDEHLTF